MKPKLSMKYTYQRGYSRYGHTIHRLGSWNKKTAAQPRPGNRPLDYLDKNATSVRNLIFGYVKKLRKFRTANTRLKNMFNEKDKEMHRLRAQTDKYQESWAKSLAKKTELFDELQTIRQENQDYEAENIKLHIQVQIQDLERADVLDQLMRINYTLIDDNNPLKNTNTESLQDHGLPQQSPTENSLGAESLNSQETARDKKLRHIATMGCIDPISSGFNTLKQGLDEHVWDPGMEEFLSRLRRKQETARRNGSDVFCMTHDVLEPYTEALNTLLNERVEEAEQKIIKKCREGIERLLGEMM